MLTTTKAFVTAAAFAGALALAIPAHAENGRNAAAAAGAVGGLAVGAAIAGAANEGRPVRRYETYDDGPRCHMERRRVQLDEDTYRVQRVRVCE